MRDIVVLVVCGVLIAAGAFVLLRSRDAPQTVALEPEPIQAVPMRIPNASTDPPAPSVSAPVRRTEPLEPRPQPANPPQPQPQPTPPSPAPQPATAQPAPTNSADSVDTPEPSERPSDTPTTPPQSDPATPDVPSSLPVRNSAQGWGVQAGAFRTSANAVALRDRLLKSGLAARVEPVDNGIYRVLVGAYATAEAARAAGAGVQAALR